MTTNLGNLAHDQVRERIIAQDQLPITLKYTLFDSTYTDPDPDRED